MELRLGTQKRKNGECEEDLLLVACKSEKPADLKKYPKML